MTLPAPWPVSTRPAARVQRNVPRRFVSMTESQSSSVVSRSGPFRENAGVVDEDVEATEFCDSSLYEGLDLFAVGDVSRDADGDTACSCDFTRDEFEVVACSPCERDRRARRGKRPGQGLGQCRALLRSLWRRDRGGWLREPASRRPVACELRLA